MFQFNKFANKSIYCSWIHKLMNVKKFPQRKFEAVWQTYAELFPEQINVTVWIGWNNWLSGSISLKCKSFFAQKNYQTREIFLVEVQYNFSEGKTSFISWFCKLDGSLFMWFEAQLYFLSGKLDFPAKTYIWKIDQRRKTLLMQFVPGTLHEPSPCSLIVSLINRVT